MSEMVGKMQAQIKKTSGDLGVLLLKVLSGIMVGLTLALITLEVLGKSGSENFLAFFFVIVVTTGAFLRISKSWGLTAVLVFDLICVLLGLVLRLYIMVAPGA